MRRGFAQALVAAGALLIVIDVWSLVAHATVGRWLALPGPISAVVTGVLYLRRPSQATSGRADIRQADQG